MVEAAVMSDAESRRAELERVFALLDRGRRGFVLMEDVRSALTVPLGDERIGLRTRDGTISALVADGEGRVSRLHMVQ